PPPPPPPPPPHFFFSTTTRKPDVYKRQTLEHSVWKGDSKESVKRTRRQKCQTKFRSRVMKRF
ncbi:hypothetical protein QN353_21405, partial [Undibacterium sp. 10I3]|nr:hypothetical protein [Undibacterium sp. 10I3]